MTSYERSFRIGDLQAVIEGAGKGAWVYHPATGEFTARFGRHDQLFGYPEAQETWSSETAERYILEDDRAIYRKALAECGSTGSVSCRLRVRWPDGNLHWIQLLGGLVYGEDCIPFCVAGDVTDVTAEVAATKAAEAMSKRLAFLEKLGRALREGGDALELQNAACEVLGRHLAANRVFYCEVDDAGWNTAGPQYTDGVLPSEGIWRTEDYDSTLIDLYRDGKVLWCNDVSRAHHLSDVQRAAYDEEEIASWAAVPIFGRDLPVGRLVVHRKVPHDWTDEELLLVKDTAERVWPLIQRARAEAKLSETALDLERAQRVASLGSYRYDPVRKDYTLSPEAMRLFGLTEGSRVTEALLLECIHADDRNEVSESWNLARRGKVTDLEYRIASWQGTIWVHQRIEIDLARDGAELATFGTVQDVSVRRELMDALRRNEQRLSLAIDAAKMGVWDANLTTGRIRWSERSRQLLGFEDGTQEPDVVNWSMHVHPEDREAVRAKFVESEAAPRDVTAEFRVTFGGKSVRWIEAHGRSEFGAAGRAVRSYGVLMDITQRKFGQMQLLESEARFRTLFQYLPVAYQSLNFRGQWIDANQKMADLLGFSSPAEMIGRNFTDFWTEEVRSAPETPFDKFKRNSELNGQIELVRKDGRKVTVMISGRVERNHEGRFVRTHCILFDVTERENMEREIRALNSDLERRIEERTAELASANVALAELARHDELTGLPNRLAANERLHLEFVTMKRTRRSYAVLMMDIDHFKTVNDRHGHAVGDRVLVMLSEALRKAVRARDFVCRYGGEEFLVLLPETDAAGAAIVAEKIRLAVHHCNDPVAGRVTISIGAVVASPHQLTEDDAVREADERLYRAKRAGRNRTVF